MRKVTIAGLAALGLALGAASAAHAQDARFMTGPQGGIWVPLGGALKDLWEKNVPGLKVQALPGAGISNVRGLEEGKAEIGFGNAISTVDALAGSEPFKTKHVNVCNLGSIYPQFMQVVVRADSGMTKVADFKGKVLTTLPRGNTTEVATVHILQSGGLTYKDMSRVNFVSASDSISQMQDNQANVWSIGTGIPAAGIMDLASGRDVRVIDLGANFDALKKMNAGYELYTIPKGTYPKQTEDVRVPGFAAHIVVSCKMDEKAVYGMTKALAENVPAMALVHKGMSGLTAKAMAANIGVPFHPGAKRYYTEKGIAVQ